MNTPLDRFERVGGRLCLDFVNTRGSHFDPAAREYVDDYAGLVGCLRLCEGGLDARQASRLAAARANGKAPARTDLETFDREAQAALAERTLTPGERWRWTWRDDGALEL